MNPWLLTIVVGYLLGSIPFGYLLVKSFMDQDIRSSGSGNIGATNVARSAKGLGAATLVLDLGKAVLAILFARHIAPGNYDMEVVAAVSAICGHIFPVWLGFRGGKGVSSALGVFILLAWPASVCMIAIFALVLLFSRMVSLASIVAALSFPVFALAFFVHHPSSITVAGFIFIPLLICAMHHQNIRRMLAGTESRIGQKKASA